MTQLIYGFIRDQQYADAIRALEGQLKQYPNSRAALSLLGYCYYHIQDYLTAAERYAQLVQVCPDVPEYRVYLAQSYYKAGQFEAAEKAAAAVTEPEYATRVTHILAATKYLQDDIAGSRAFLAKAPENDPDSQITEAALNFKEGKIAEAKEQFINAMNMVGYQPDLAYNIALCYYKELQYAQALKMANEIIEKGVRDHPELSVGSSAEGGDVQSVGNSQALRESALLEAFNLKAAIELKLNNVEGAQRALLDMPPRSEDEIDCVTLHNQALVDVRKDPSKAFKKLQHLLRNPPHPPETFGNLLLLYIKHQLYDLAADVLADYPELHQTCLSQDLLDFLVATIESHSSLQGKAEAFQKLDIIAERQVDQLRKHINKIQGSRRDRQDEGMRKALQDYDQVMEKYIPVLTAQAKIYWDLGNYAMVERILWRSHEFCQDHDTWNLNFAHVKFMRGDYAKAIALYEPLVREHASTNILDVTAIVLANLCVAYVMTSRNEAAADLMRQIDQEEERQMQIDPTSQWYHLCIVNIVIGTLYCSKGQYAFGIDRVIKAFDPLPRKLSADTWFHAKRCFLALAEACAKHMFVMTDSTFHDVITFLNACETHGHEIRSNVSATGNDIGGQVESGFEGEGNADDTDGANPDSSTGDDERPRKLSAMASSSLSSRNKGVLPRSLHTVAYEARLLKRLFIKLRESC